MKGVMKTIPWNEKSGVCYCGDDTCLDSASDSSSHDNLMVVDRNV